MSRFDSADQDRRLDGLIRVGVVEETTGDTVRVRIGEILTQPIPVKMGAAGRMRVWAPPSVGEQVVVAAPGGEPDAAVALPGLYSSAAPAPSDSLDETRIVSIHAPAKGRPPANSPDNRRCLFLSTPPRRGDDRARRRPRRLMLFLSTPPRRGDRCIPRAAR